VMKALRCLETWRFAQGSVLIKYIVTYATILLLPCIILGLSLFNSATEQMKQNAIESQQYSAEQLAKSLSSELDDLISIITRIDESRAMFWPSKWKNDLYNQTSISWELNKYRKYSFLLEDCILVYKNHNAVFTSTTHDCTDSFFQRVQVGDEQLSRILSTTNTRAILPVDMNDTTSDRRYEALLYIVPFNMEKIRNNDMVMVFVLPSERLDRWARRYLNTQNYRFWLFDKNDTPLFSFGTLNPEDSYRKVMDFQIAGDSQRQIFADDIAVSLFRLNTRSAGAQAVLEVPWEGAVQQLIEFRKLFYITGTTTIVLGFLLAILFSYYNYSPIKRILASLKKQAPALIPVKAGNEYSQLNDAVSAAITRNRSLEEHINNQTRAFYMEILSGLLTGTVQYSKIDRTLDVCTSLPGPYYCVLALPRLREPLSAQQRENSLSCVYEIVDIPSYRCTAIIISLDHGDESYQKTRVHCLYNLYSGKSQLCMGVSEIHSHIAQLNKCMIEAILALKHIEDQDSTGIQYYNDTLQKQLQLLIPETVLYSFTQSLKDGDEEQCIGIFDNMMDTIEACRNPIIAQIQCYEIANAVLRVMNDIVGYGTVVEIDYFDLYQNVEYFRNRTKPILTAICRSVSRCHDDPGRDLFAAILNYVNDHCLDYDISLEKLASTFGQSVSMVSKMFKLHIGIGFKEYLSNKRLDTARHLLCSTTMPVHEITIALGYTDVSHFIKRFKIVNGMTPAQYRKRYGYIRG
jgi:two-component system response regulator YesN